MRGDGNYKWVWLELESRARERAREECTKLSFSRRQRKCYGHTDRWKIFLSDCCILAWAGSAQSQAQPNSTLFQPKTGKIMLYIPYLALGWVFLGAWLITIIWEKHKYVRRVQFYFLFFIFNFIIYIYIYIYLNPNMV